ncbi:hypothetical protein PV368_11010 [Streptomyces sp. ME02-6979A]|nr:MULTISPECIES: hypothetical protein [unclassified Streptomyces]MDX3345961.1 hypothetical protein [Streptomyces sp. ME02-6979A]MDX3421727.1 hypothetical protein [Streptomyces sp. ME02-6985-2c]
MTSTTHAEAETATVADGGVLPPYSGTDAVCPKCVFNEAFTWYRPAITRPTNFGDFNGKHARRGPLPERLERECSRCSFKWDEALVVSHLGMTVDALVYALDNSTPYRIELDRPVLEYMAFKLLGALHITARPDNPLWKYSDGRPPAPVAPQDPADAEGTPR